MGVLKWCGYTIATLLALAVVAGGGLIIAAIVTIGGAVLCFAALVALVGFLIEDSYTSVFKRTKRKT